MSTLSTVASAAVLDAVNYRPHTQPSLPLLKGITLCFQSIAFLTTVYRLVLRYRKQGLWWDDFWAFLALIANMSMVISLMIYIHPGESHKARVVAIWINFSTFTIGLWLARISLAVALVRISPPASLMRRSSIAVTIIFGFIGLALLLQRSIYCSFDRNWILTPHHNPVCGLSVSVSIASVCTDLVADFLLMFIPIRALRRSKLDRKYRRLILVLFTASTLTTLASFPQAATQIWIGGSFTQLTSQVEVAVALTVCNLLILVTHFYRVFGNGEDLESSYDYSTSRRRQIPAPTIDFGGRSVDISAHDSGLTSVYYSTDDQQSQIASLPHKSEKSADLG